MTAMRMWRRGDARMKAILAAMTGVRVQPIHTEIGTFVRADLLEQTRKFLERAARNKS